LEEAVSFTPAAAALGILWMTSLPLLLQPQKNKGPYPRMTGPRGETGIKPEMQNQTEIFSPVGSY